MSIFKFYSLVKKGTAVSAFITDNSNVKHEAIDTEVISLDKFFRNENGSIDPDRMHKVYAFYKTDETVLESTEIVVYTFDYSDFSRVKYMESVIYETDETEDVRYSSVIDIPDFVDQGNKVVVDELSFLFRV